jgi:dTDP-4-amino-4,6-dideoxygalactose transaminase
MEMEVPLVDLRAQYVEIREEVRRAVEAVFESQQFILGPNVTRLEEQIAAYSNVGHGIGVSSGTDAILVSLMALGIGQGDGVITSPYTFFATGGVIARLGAKPIFVDINPHTYNIAPEKLGELLEEKCRLHEDTGKPVEKKTRCLIKAMIPVHLFGQCTDMDPIMEMAKRAHLDIIEDAAQAIGATYYSKRLEDQARRPAIADQALGVKLRKGNRRSETAYKAGSMGRVGCFSFFPTKNLGGFGDGGMVVTDDEPLAEKIRTLRVHGGQQMNFRPLFSM